jgi:hypothetical protein
MGDVLIFPRSRAKKSRSEDLSPSHLSAQILFFTGVRYERAGDLMHTQGDQPKHPPSRPRRKRA